MKDIHWLAGVLDQRGSWGFQRTGRGTRMYLQFELADESVAREVGRILGVTYRSRVRTEGWTDNPTYVLRKLGRGAHGWLMTLAGAMRSTRRNDLIDFLRGV